MKGFVPTPPATVDLMVDRLFRDLPPQNKSRLLDPGCGHGAFIEGVLRWCRRQRSPIPAIVGIELDPNKLQQARRVLAREPKVTLLHGDFLKKDLGEFDYVVGNPPYVAIDKLSEEEREQYRSKFAVARGRIDLYLLFWERALQVLRAGGRMVFITPEKFAYVETARSLRKMLSQNDFEELCFAGEDTFPGLVTYPTISIIRRRAPQSATRVVMRNGTQVEIRLPVNGDSWQPMIYGSPKIAGARTLADVAVRISCGVATGADKLFLFRADQVPVGLARFSRPTVAGRELREGQPFPSPRYALLMPYDSHGQLLPLRKLGSLESYLQKPEIRKRLEARTCAKRKPWYAFHETPPLDEMLRPKLVCKDITVEPCFWIERRGDVVPLHSTYYIVLQQPELLEPVAAFLNSSEARRWLRANCQRAANGYLRVQSAILKNMPIPDTLAEMHSSRAVAA